MINIDLPILLYNTIVLSIVSSVSLIIATSIEFIKNTGTESYQIRDVISLLTTHWKCIIILHIFCIHLQQICLNNKIICEFIKNTGTESYQIQFDKVSYVKSKNNILYENSVSLFFTYSAFICNRSA